MPFCGFTISARMMYVHAIAFITRKLSKICGSAAGISTVRITCALRGAQRERGLHQLLGHRADRVDHHRAAGTRTCPRKRNATFCVSSMPNQRMSSGMNAVIGR